MYVRKVRTLNARINVEGNVLEAILTDGHLGSTKGLSQKIGKGLKQNHGESENRTEANKMHQEEKEKKEYTRITS